MSDKPRKPLIPWTKPKRKTRAELFAELVFDLCDRGNKGLTKRIDLGPKRSLKDLENVYRQLALQSFEKHYQYGYSATPLKAVPKTNLGTKFNGFFRVKDSYKPPVPTHHTQGVGSHSSSKGDFVSAGGFESGGDFVSQGESIGSEFTVRKPIVPLVPDTSKTPAEIKGDIAQCLSSLPGWCKDEATAKLVQEIDCVLNSPQGGLGTPSSWKEHLFSTPYDAPSGKYDNSIRGDVLFISVRGSLADGDVRAEIVAFYCIGVYYYTLSPATLAKQSLWASLCDGANLLLDKPLAISNPPNTDELMRMLRMYGVRQFSEAFRMELNSVPDESVEFLGHAQNLFIYEDDDLSALEKELEDSIFSSFHIPEWTTARKEITDQVSYLANDTTHNNGNWIAVKFDRPYFPKLPSDLTVVVKANFVHCILVAPQFSKVSYRCVYVSGLFYKVTGAKNTIENDLTKTIYLSAKSVMPDNHNHPPDVPTKDDLDALLSSALEYQFKEKFKFKFDGESTLPPDAITPGALFAGKGSFEVDSTADPATLVDTIMKAFNFPEWSDEADLKHQIRTSLFLRVKDIVAQDPIAILANQWVISEWGQPFSYAANEEAALCGKIIFVYCNGSMSQINQKISLNKTFGYFCGVYYDQPVMEW